MDRGERNEYKNGIIDRSVAVLWIRKGKQCVATRKSNDSSRYPWELSESAYFKFAANDESKLEVTEHVHLQYSFLWNTVSREYRHLVPVSLDTIIQYRHPVPDQYWKHPVSHPNSPLIQYPSSRTGWRYRVLDTGKRMTVSADIGTGWRFGWR